MPLTAAVIVLALWGGWFIHRTSFEVEGQRFYSLFDDAMISMTYARNLVEGHGLNWAREGAPVEGFTTPLWTFLMIGANIGDSELGIRPLFVQIASLLLLAAHVVLVSRLVGKHFSPGQWSTTVPAVVLTAFYYPLNFWGLVGMETALQAVLATGAVYLALEVGDGRSRRIIPLFLVLSLAYLTRMDMALLSMVVLAYLFLVGGMSRDHARRWIIGGLILGFAVVAYEAFRWIYFDALLPNTYYLKLTGVPMDVRLLRGVSVFVAFLRENAWFLVPVALGVLPLLSIRVKLRLPVCLFAVYSAYSIYVGGDAWEMHNNVRANRFMVFLVPQVFVVANALVNEVLCAAWRRRGLERFFGSAAGRLHVVVVPTLILLLVSNGLWLSSEVDKNWRAITLLDRPLLVTSHVLVVRDLRRLQRTVAPGARVATFWAGIPAYYSDYRMVDMLGYSDRTIARRAAARPLGPDRLDAYTPGHVKWDYEYVFAEKPPDAFLQAWHLGAGIEETMASHGYRLVNGFWVREDSLWLLPEFR